MTFTQRTDAEHNNQGSFYYPPSVRSAEQAIAFWEHVDIDDSTLRDFENAYDKRLNSLANPRYEARVSALVEKKLAKYDSEVTAYHQTAEYQKLWDNADEVGRSGSKATEAEGRLHNFGIYETEARNEVDPPSVAEIDPAQIPYPALNRSEVRPLVRAAGLYAYTPAGEKITAEDRETIMNHQIDLGYNKFMTVREIESAYVLSEIDTFLDG